ncbi:MAG: isoprenyl transferase [Pseudomonadota bacterium]
MKSSPAPATGRFAAATVSDPHGAMPVRAAADAVSLSSPEHTPGDGEHTDHRHKPVPRHVAIIMDGNGRWAKARGLARADGHREGVEAARRAVEAAGDLGVQYLTLYSFSTENWRRPANEVRDLMDLLRKFIAVDLPKLATEGVRVRIIGDRRNLDFGLRKLVERAERETAANDQFYLQIAFNYGGRNEIVRMAQAVAERVRAGSLGVKDIDEKTLNEFLDTDGLPDPDLVVRTSGEKRVSNFLIWQAAYAEYVFLDHHWPDFDADLLQAAVREYQTRDRRFGGVDGSATDANAADTDQDRGDLALRGTPAKRRVDLGG